MAQSLPVLLIDYGTGSQVRLSWTNTPGIIVLEEADNLTPTSVWQPFPQNPTLLNGQFSVMVDMSGRSRRFFRLHLIQTGGLPPDPASIAPPVPLGVATQMAEATAFLYTGPNVIQTGVAPGTIDARRAAVVRGTVKTRDTNPLSGVTISILHHPEFGQTLSRADGMFDLAVNGGGLLTINCQKTGFLPAQRQVNAPWQDFVIAPDTVLIPVDTQVTIITANAGVMQAARGSIMSDSDGSRQATILFPAGTTATMVMPDGSSQPLPSLNVRATEYTVGANGPSAMPGALPPTSGYTYAVELSADEAIAADARSITFSQPLFNYVENFLVFPVGMIVPNGYYDRDRAAWLPSDNGRVIKITGESAGLAIVDTVGAGGLPPLTLSTEERQQLALLYPVGQELWRVPISHFTPWDHNWPFGPPADAVQPAGIPDADEPLDDPCTQTGSSIIEGENQTLGETIGIVGTRFALHYQSDRVLGRRAAFMLEIPLSGAQPPASLRRIELEILVAGRRFAQNFAAAPNQRHSFTWDGKDIYGREVQGATAATVRIGYVYGAVYQQPAQFGQSFAAFSGTPLTGSRARQEITIWRESHRSLGTLRAQEGGWSLSSHHAYDTNAKVLYQGDGTRRHADTIGRVITSVNNIFTASGNVLGVWDVSVAPDGSVYAALNSSIRRIAPDGSITIVAGGVTIGALSGNVRGVAVAPDSSFYIADNALVRRVSPNGVLTTVAGGGGTSITSGDGLPATQLAFNPSTDVAVAPDGGFYFTFSNPIHGLGHVGLNGIYTRIAGVGTSGFGGDGGPAKLARLSTPRGLVVAPDGSIYFVDSGNQRIRRIDTNGIISTVAGTGVAGFSGDGGPAIQARLAGPDGMAMAPDGSLFIAEFANGRIRRIGPDGIITTVAGNGVGGFSGDGGFATQAMVRPAGVAVAPDGSFYVADFLNGRVRRVAAALPGISADESLIPSEDGSQLYEFSAGGRHLRTRDAFTSTILYLFAYDSGGRLTAVTDASGNVTTIQRDVSGNPTAIVGPFGQSTALAVNPNGYLSQITSPAGENVQLAYTTDGLLTSLTNPRGHLSSYTFDTLGRLTSATDPTGAVKTIARTGTSKDSTVTVTTALGRMTTYRVEHLSNGDMRHTTTDSAGKQIQVVNSQNGNQTATYPDGTTVSAVPGPDPRWGMQAPLAASVVVTTPGGKVHTTTIQRTVTLTTSTNPLSLATMNETVTINGRAFRRAYNAASRTFTQTAPTGRQRTTVVDLLGKPVQAQFGGLAARSFTYDLKGRLASTTRGSGAGGRTLTLAYGVNGFLQSATDAASRTLAFARDANGRTTGLTFPDGGQAHSAYDANGNVTTLAPPGRPDHMFAYNQRNQVSTCTAPIVGAQNSQTLNTYNADRQTLQVDFPDGQSVGLQYDTAGRPSVVDIVLGDMQFGYDSAGRLATLTRDQGAALAYTYDGGLPAGTTWSGAIAGSVTRAYDNNFRVTSLNVNGNSPIAFSYDLDGLLIQAGSLTLTRNAQNGLVTGTALGTVTDTITYDVFGAPATHTASQGGGAIYSATYTRDALGRIATRGEIIDGIAHTFAYSYDLAGRLTEVRKDDVLTASYSYDTNGNRLSRTGGGGTSIANYDSQDRLDQFGATTYLHNANGERQSKTAAGQTTNYQYDTFGNLAGVTLPGATQIDYLLDGEQRRVGRKVNGTLLQGFLYQDGLKPIAELEGSNNVVSRFVYSHGINVPAYMIKAGVTYRIVTDHLGSTRLVIDSSTGVIAQMLDYDEFGKVTLDTNPGFQPFGFAGGLYDPSSGLVHYGARDYEPDTGRWITRDPIEFSGGTNLYAYAANNPVNLIDPLGNDPVDPFGSTGAGPPPGLNTVGSSGDASLLNNAQVENARMQAYIRAENRNFFNGPDARNYSGSNFSDKRIPFGTNSMSGTVGGDYRINLDRCPSTLTPTQSAGAAGGLRLLVGGGVRVAAYRLAAGALVLAAELEPIGLAFIAIDFVTGGAFLAPVPLPWEQ